MVLDDRLGREREQEDCFMFCMNKRGTVLFVSSVQCPHLLGVNCDCVERVRNEDRSVAR